METPSISGNSVAMTESDLKARLAELEPLIRDNYAARERGELPDEMFWADREALTYGYALNDEGELEPILQPWSFADAVRIHQATA